MNNTETSRIKFTRTNPSMRGPRSAVQCFDCGEMTKAPLQVYRMTDGTRVERRWDSALVVYVHRTGTGCHKNHTDSDVRMDEF